MTPRPLAARSVLASLLLGTAPPRLPAKVLVRAAELLGVSEGATRVALSRMVSAGEVTSAGGWYELSGSLLDRRRRQEEGRRPATRPWDGTWIVAVVGTAAARRPPSERAAARRGLAELRLAEWREGVWLRPDNLRVEPHSVEGCSWVRGARPDDEGLAAQLWDLEGWSSSARQLLAEMDEIPPSALPRAFELAAAVVRHLRDDPLLPSVLLSEGWPGDQLRGAYDAYEGAFQAALRELLASGDPTSGSA